MFGKDLIACEFSVYVKYRAVSCCLPLFQRLDLTNQDNPVWGVYFEKLYKFYVFDFFSTALPKLTPLFLVAIQVVSYDERKELY